MAISMVLIKIATGYKIALKEKNHIYLLAGENKKLFN